MFVLFFLISSSFFFIEKAASVLKATFVCIPRKKAGKWLKLDNDGLVSILGKKKILNIWLFEEDGKGKTDIDIKKEHKKKKYLEERERELQV